MADILAWSALIILVVAVWLLAGRFTSGRAGAVTSPDDEFRGGV